MTETLPYLVLFAASCAVHAALAKPEEASPALPCAVPVTLPFEKVLPGVVTDYEIMTANGAWGKEYLLETRRLPDTGFRFVQDKGRSGATMKPWISVRNTTNGQGVALLLAYSGNWVLEVLPRNGQTVLRADTSPGSLKPFDRLGGMPVPGALVAEFTGHWDGGAQPLARFIRSRLRRELGPDWPPVQYNTWYDAFEKIGEPRVIEAVRVAAELGCELFTVDAGWYGSGLKADWSGELGKWQENRDRFPRGLEAIAADARRRGMKFGLWVEIECAAPGSPVARQHPDWILNDGARRISGRTALDFGNPEALAWAKAEIDRLVTTYALDYIKMDFNTDLPVNGQSLAPDADPLVRHYRGLADLWKHMRATYPKLIVENCSSGSLRQDAMTAALTDTHWVSDEVGNAANLAMNLGATYLFPPEICSHWTTAPGAQGQPLDREASFTANMLGHMGLSGKINEWDADTRKVAAERIALYKTIRAPLCRSDVFHLTPPISASKPGSVQAALYADPGNGTAILFAFQGGDPALDHFIVLRGLDPGRPYFLRMPQEYGADRVLSGKMLVETGLDLRFPRVGAAAVIRIEPRRQTTDRPER